MIMNVAMAIHGASIIWKAGRMAMKATEMPARVPSIAARGVKRRIVGPMNAPRMTIRPMNRAHSRPASQASTALLVLR